MIGRSMVPTYLRYIVPSMIAFTLTSIYGIVDGLFVGNVVGDAGLAGINVSFPLVQFVFAVGTGIGMGGAVISSIRAGRGDEASSRRAVGNTLLMLVVASLPLMAVLLMFGAPLSELLGGRGATLAEAVNYITVIAWGTPFLVLQVGCLPLIRNRGHVNYAMGVSVLSGLVNVALDWLFVVELHAGTAGAAAATVIAQALAFALCAAFFLRKGERIALRDQLHEVEHRGDELNHAIVQRINSSFITPFDREDLQSLASHLDDCLDFIDEAGDLLVVYGIADIPTSLVSLLNEQIAVIEHCAALTAENMPKLKSPVDMRDYWIEVNRLENEGDLAYRRTLTALFDSGLDPVTIIKLKDIVQGLESCTDAFEELANVIESLALKES